MRRRWRRIGARRQMRTATRDDVVSGALGCARGVVTERALWMWEAHARPGSPRWGPLLLELEQGVPTSPLTPHTGNRPVSSSRHASRRRARTSGPGSSPSYF